MLVVPYPRRHVVVPLLPIDDTASVANVAEILDKLVRGGCARKRENGFDISDTIESIERRRKHFLLIRSTDEHVFLIGAIEKLFADGSDTGADFRDRLHPF